MTKYGKKNEVREKHHCMFVFIYFIVFIFSFIYFEIKKKYNLIIMSFDVNKAQSD